MTTQEIVDAINASGLSASDLTALLKRGKGVIDSTKKRVELGVLMQQRQAALVASDQAIQAKQAEIAQAEAAQAALFGVGA